MKKIILVILPLVLLCCELLGQNSVSIIPQPNLVKTGDGQLLLNDNFVIYGSEDQSFMIHEFQEFLNMELKTNLSGRKIKTEKNYINLFLSNEMIPKGNEAYKLKVNNDGIEIMAAYNTGLFYGLQSLKQLVICADKSHGNIILPFVEITDQPRFSWRAFMLDEARYFKGKDQIKKLINEMAFYKMNVFHWHLVDDPGWRIEIKKYPKLTEVGSKRSNSQIGPLKWQSPLRSGEPHGGYYTQEDIRDIINYARERNITIVPEIDMPGHSSAAIASYPWLGTIAEKIDVPDTFRTDDILNITDPKVLQFLTDVLDEIIELFPSDVIHIGGDEVPFNIWRKSESIRLYMENEGIKSMADLQISFNNKISQYLESKGKKLMGWNDILGDQLHGYTIAEDHKTEKELAKNSIVHFWKGDIKLARTAAQRGYDIVNSLHTSTYLDYTYKNISLEDAYNFDPVPAGLEKEFHNKVIGMGCQMWGEWIPTSGEMDYMVFPRLTAYAEAAWTFLQNKDYETFRALLPEHYVKWSENNIYPAPISIADPIIKPRIDIKDAPAPLFRDPVFDGAADPTVIWNDQTAEWLVFYTQRRANLQLKGVEYCYGTAIGIAGSSDFGKTWTYKGTARLPQPDPGHNSFWAPQVFYDKNNKNYHMFVTYIKGIYDDWGGERQILHYQSSDLNNWEEIKSVGTSGCIDASVYQMDDGSWKMWYKDEKNGSFTYSSTSNDLVSWQQTGIKEVSNCRHEAPIVFRWKGKYCMITDPCVLDFSGLDCFISDDATNWKFNNSILNSPGARPDDNEQGRHADVKVIDDKAYIFYFTHPGRVYKDRVEVEEPDLLRYRRSSLQVAELEMIDGKILCNRDKYLQPSPHK